ncbi:hypothetical protein MXMO3_03501 (plasmid) [Maritalea myrionectae]|uniref:Type IV secretion system protein virB2 n=1 Tax=Maritalea myrionectae TaxID=454601 RepID=A0A2R4MJ64_9HYPH|nr:hypothetical protein [Maritalea myrionectae]AVX06004.1 hypothetical protein MXMO3_03501 [Maritalea myrionectae]
MKKFIKRCGLAVSSLAATAITAGNAFAAGTTTIETEFTTVANDMLALVQGSGALLVTAVSLGIAAIMLMFGQGWKGVIYAFAGSFILGSGFAVMTGISGATATTALLGF